MTTRPCGSARLPGRAGWSISARVRNVRSPCPAGGPPGSAWRTGRARRHRCPWPKSSIPGLRATRSLVLPRLPAGSRTPDAVVLRASRDGRTGCVEVGAGVRCAPGRDRPGEEDQGMTPHRAAPCPGRLRGHPDRCAPARERPRHAARARSPGPGGRLVAGRQGRARVGLRRDRRGRGDVLGRRGRRRAPHPGHPVARSTQRDGTRPVRGCRHGGTEARGRGPELAGRTTFRAARLAGSLSLRGDQDRPADHPRREGRAGGQPRLRREHHPGRGRDQRAAPPGWSRPAGRRVR